MKRKIAVLLGSVSLLSLGTVFLSSAAMNESQARALADSKVPSGSVYLWTEDEDGKYEFRYFNDSRQENYEVKVNKYTSQIHSFDSELVNKHGGSKVTVTEETAKRKVTNEISGARILSVELDYDDGIEYEIRFSADALYGEYKIHSEDGRVLERDIKIGAAQSGANGGSASGYLSQEKIRELALAQVPGGVVTDIDLETGGFGAYYEVEVYKDGVEYELAFHASTGELAWNHSHQKWNGGSNHGNHNQGSQNNSGYIGIERAKQIALAKAPGAVVTKCELDSDDGRVVYEGEMRKGQWEYEFEIDAITGEIVKWEQDYDD